LSRLHTLARTLVYTHIEYTRKDLARVVARRNSPGGLS
jgi:hypothetical protein